MKRLVIIGSILMITLSAFSQNRHVFVLVDISKSVQQTDLINAKQALFEVLTGSNLTTASVSTGNSQDMSSFKLVVGDRVSIAVFGDLQTSLAINPHPLQFTGNISEIKQVLNEIEWKPKDNLTYLTLAKAKIAEYAQNQTINEYKLYIISDNINDNYGPNGKPSYPNIQVQNLAENYNTKSNQVIEEGSTKIKFSPTSLFTLTFIPKVDISKYNTGGSAPPTFRPTITITSFSGGNKTRPKTLNSRTFTISWSCNCPPDTRFAVALTQVEGGNFKDLSKKNILSNSVKYSDIPPGKYRIVVSAPNADSDTTYIEIPSKGLALLIVILLLFAGGGVGYYFWNKKRQEKIETSSSDKADDIFSKGTGTTKNSANSDYF